jgi:hypothetical protein
MKLERVQSSAEYAKGDGEPSNAFPLNPIQQEQGLSLKLYACRINI